ncbi:hypothetical protein Q8F55_005450 [Vanrija albida]|uniref:GATA-type domain-containing protein n=1 Tax=Vanrija albida TaxID=181172 RepID=A0ABR3Q2G2_9TREE
MSTSTYSNTFKPTPVELNIVPTLPPAHPQCPVCNRPDAARRFAALYPALPHLAKINCERCWEWYRRNKTWESPNPAQCHAQAVNYSYLSSVAHPEGSAWAQHNAGLARTAPLKVTKGLPTPPTTPPKHYSSLPAQYSVPTANTPSASPRSSTSSYHTAASRPDSIASTASFHTARSSIQSPPKRVSALDAAIASIHERDAKAKRESVSSTRNQINVPVAYTIPDVYKPLPTIAATERAPTTNIIQRKPAPTRAQAEVSSYHKHKALPAASPKMANYTRYLESNPLPTPPKF